jgi:ABC-type branched-subunit amino acid transport system substrate-binding protein
LISNTGIANYQVPDEILFYSLIDLNSIGGTITNRVLHSSLPNITKTILGNMTRINTQVINTDSLWSIIPVIVPQLNTSIPFVAYLGPSTSRGVVELLGYDTDHLVISYSATDASISANNFVRVIPSDEIQVKAISKFIEKIGCPKIGIIKSLDTYGTDFYTDLDKEFKNEGMRVNIEGPLVLDPTEYQSTFNQIVKFKETPIIFVVVSYPLTKKIIEFAIKNDMTGPEYTWIFSQGAVWNMQEFLEDAKNLSHWYASVAPTDPLPSFINKSIISPAINIFSPYVYDSVLLLVTTIRNLIDKELLTQETNFSVIRNEMISLDIQGLTGKIHFDLNGERKSKYLLINGVNQNELSQIAFYDSDTGEFKVTNTNAITGILCELPKAKCTSSQNELSAPMKIGFFSNFVLVLVVYLLFFMGSMGCIIHLCVTNDDNDNEK